jgi:hypothetical protein
MPQRSEAISVRCPELCPHCGCTPPELAAAAVASFGRQTLRSAHAAQQHVAAAMQTAWRGVT